MGIFGVAKHDLRSHSNRNRPATCTIQELVGGKAPTRAVAPVYSSHSANNHFVECSSSI